MFAQLEEQDNIIAQSPDGAVKLIEESESEISYVTWETERGERIMWRGNYEQAGAKFVEIAGEHFTLQE